MTETRQAIDTEKACLQKELAGLQVSNDSLSRENKLLKDKTSKDKNELTKRS